MSYDPEQPAWSIMTKSHGGTVSVIRGLTLEEARRTYERLDPWHGHHLTQYATHPDFLEDGTSACVWGSGGRTVSDGDIEVREVFGPPGWSGFEEVEHWPKFTTIYCDAEGNPLSEEYQEA